MARPRKRSAAQVISDAAAAQQQSILEANQAYQQSAQDALGQYVEQQNDLIRQAETENENLKRQTQSAYDEVFGDEGILTKAYQQRQNDLTAAQTEVDDQVRRDEDAAKYTALTEAAASIANLIGVGRGASNQKVASYSQDWMRKADADTREGRNRIDRIRADVSAQQERLAQGRLQGNLAALGLDRDRIQQILSMRGNLAGAAYQGALNAIGRDYEGRVAAASAGAQGEYHAASAQQSDEHNAAAMRARGFNPDGSINEDTFEKIATTTRRYSGSGSDKTNEYPIATADGKVHMARLTKDQLEFIVNSSQDELTRNLDRDTAKEFDRKIRMAKDEKAKAAIIQEYMGKTPGIVDKIVAADPGFLTRDAAVPEKEEEVKKGASIVLP